MCSIIKATSKEMLLKLVDLNQEKGTFSNSIATVNNNHTNIVSKQFGMFNKEDFTIDQKCDYFLAHVQAPTGGLSKDTIRIHPAIANNIKVYHNGLLKQSSIKMLQERLEVKNNFDTYLLARAIEAFGFDILSEIEGSFACIVLTDGKFYMFRTKHSKLYADDNGNVSSEKLDDSFKCIKFDTIYDENLNEVGTFKTKSFNYIVPAEM